MVEKSKSLINLKIVDSQEEEDDQAIEMEDKKKIKALEPDPIVHINEP